MVIDFIRKVFAFLSSLWALADIVLDIVTVIRYRDLCQVKRLLSSQQKTFSTKAFFIG